MMEIIHKAIHWWQKGYKMVELRLKEPVRTQPEEPPPIPCREESISIENIAPKKVMTKMDLGSGKSNFIRILIGAVLLVLGLGVLGVHEPPFGQFGYNNRVFFCALWVSIPAALVLEHLLGIVTGRPSKIWVRNPSATSRHESDEALSCSLSTVQSALASMGFDVRTESVGEGSALVHFKKDKIDRAETFFESKFSGQVALAEAGGSTSLQTVVTLIDTILVDSGEQSKLSSLADFLSLKSELSISREVPLTLLCGYVLACAVPVGLLLHFQWDITWFGMNFILPVGLAGFFLLMAGLRSVVFKRSSSYGYRYGVLGLLLCVLPLGSLFF